MDKCLYEYIEVLNLKICVINVKMYQDKTRQEMRMSRKKQLAGYEVFSKQNKNLDYGGFIVWHLKKNY